MWHYVLQFALEKIYEYQTEKSQGPHGLGIQIDKNLAENS